MERGHGKESTYTPASATLPGATSKDVYQGYGHPGSGETSKELHHDGTAGRKHQGYGLEGVGASVPEHFQRDLPRQHRGTAAPNAEDVQPESAESVAHLNK